MIKVNMKHIEKKLAETKQVALNNSEKVSWHLASRVKAIAQLKSPYQTGKLFHSCKIEKTLGGFEVSFNTDYALQVHEEPQEMRATGEERFLARAVDSVFDKEFKDVGLKAFTDGGNVSVGEEL